MKIVARIRQLLSANDTTVAPVVEEVPRPVADPPEYTFRGAAERPPTPQLSPRAPSAVPLAAKIVPLLREPLVTPTKGGVRLEGESIEHPIVDPSEAIIRQELERLRSSGPSHLALIASDGSYLQAAGNAKRMTVEAHLVARHAPPMLFSAARVRSGLPSRLSQPPARSR